MTHSVTPAPPRSPFLDPISQAIERLRQLTQVEVQTGWRYCLADLPAGEAAQAKNWQDWAIASLNLRHHIPWGKGQQVLWLGQSITIPPDLQGYSLSGLTLRLALTWWAEVAQIFVNGALVQEGDLFDCSARILLNAAVQPGETVEIALRLVSPNHDDGALVRSLCLYEASDSETRHPEPGFIADELAVLQHYLTAFEPEKLEAVVVAVNNIPWSMLCDRSRFDSALAALRQQLQPLGDGLKQRHIYLLGHAHLDLAWLWAVSETWNAAERTFQSVLRLQQDFPTLIFCHSTPALYAWIEANRPDLFTSIQEQIAARRWEVVAGLWVEPELNLVCGESIARQVLYGQRYVQEKFGRVSAIAWLPDSFGFCWQLPQILKQGEIDSFVTQKLRWNDTNPFPHELFWWQAPDGSQILSLNSAPIGEGIDPVKMSRYASHFEAETGIPSALWLIGVGDHGGGPTRDMLEIAHRWQQSPFFPTLTFSTALDYLKSLEEGLHPLPIWNTELYLEFHRGCYTTHADQKRQNRRCEGLLYQAELFASIATLLIEATYPKADIEAAWKLMLFNQFHDILPGSSIPEVYGDANRDWKQVEQIGERILAEALAAIASQIILPDPPQPNSQPIFIFNPLNWERSEGVAIALPNSPTPEQNWQIYDSTGQTVPSQRRSDAESTQLLFQANHIPGVGYRVFWLTQAETVTDNPSSEPASEDWTLENEALRVVIDSQTGDLSSVFDKIQQREVLSAPGNQLQAFRDSGQYWDAWNIDPAYAQQPLLGVSLRSLQWLDRGVVQSRLRVVRQLGQSEFCQDYVLEADSAVLKIETTVNWQERQTIVKAAFPLNLETDYATYEIPYGAIQRPTQASEPRDKAQWEVPALQWADLSEAKYGVSLLNDCKYGYDSQPSQIRLTLLRGASWPNPQADLGWHQFTYALYPHPDRWQAAHTVHRGYELNQPLRVQIGILTDGTSSPCLPPVGQFLNLQAENIVLTAFKQSEEDTACWVLRGYECHGDSAEIPLSDLGLAFKTEPNFVPVNLLENPSPLEYDPETDSQTYRIAPWKIVAIALKLTQKILKPDFNLRDLQKDRSVP